MPRPVDTDRASDSVPQSGRARVVVSVTASVDGRVALRHSGILLDPVDGVTWQAAHPPGAADLTAARDADLGRRFAPRAVLEGSGSFVAHDAPAAVFPEPDVPTAELLEHHLPGPLDRRWFVVVDSRGRVRWTHTGDDETRLLVLVAAATPAGYLAHLRARGIPYLVAGRDRVDLPVALDLLAARLGIGWVVSQAGGELNGALLRAGLVEEVHLVVLPVVVGGRDTPAVFDGGPLGAGESPTVLRLTGVERSEDGALWLRYARPA